MKTEAHELIPTRKVPAPAFLHTAQEEKRTAAPRTVPPDSPSVGDVIGEAGPGGVMTGPYIQGGLGEEQNTGMAFRDCLLFARIKTETVQQRNRTL